MKHYNMGKDELTLIGTKDEIVDYYAQLDEKNIEFANMVDINFAENEERISLLTFG